MNPDIFSLAGAAQVSRWIHFMAGVTWIGLLYYFNFVQGEYFKEATPDAKSDAVKKLAPRALWWFRYGALLTFLSGVVILPKVLDETRLKSVMSLFCKATRKTLKDSLFLAGRQSVREDFGLKKE